MKGVSNADVAREFKIKPPSVIDWKKFGRIGKQHIEHLVAFFSDVVGPEHWGIERLPSSQESTHKLTPGQQELQNAVLRHAWRMPHEQCHHFAELIRAAAVAEPTASYGMNGTSRPTGAVDVQLMRRCNAVVIECLHKHAQATGEGASDDLIFAHAARLYQLCEETGQRPSLKLARIVLGQSA